jgi:hypothetical protein
LAGLGTELDLSNDERVSVYVHDANLHSFQMVSRYATNPKLQERGRTVYQDDQGIIGRAWRDGWSDVQDLPDWNEDPSAYQAQNYRDFGIPIEVTDGLNMKSRSLAGLRYPAEPGQQPLGVLVVESNDPARVTPALRDRLEESRNWGILRDHLHTQRRQLPLLSEAKGKGF